MKGYFRKWLITQKGNFSGKKKDEIWPLGVNLDPYSQAVRERKLSYDWNFAS
jgi:hypothetical protein